MYTAASGTRGAEPMILSPKRILLILRPFQQEHTHLATWRTNPLVGTAWTRSTTGRMSFARNITDVFPTCLVVHVVSTETLCSAVRLRWPLRVSSRGQCHYRTMPGIWGTPARCR